MRRRNGHCGITLLIAEPNFMHEGDTHALHCTEAFDLSLVSFGLLCFNCLVHFM